MKKHSSEHQFAIRLMEHLVVPTFVLDPSGKVLIWNKACERLTNVMAHEVIGTRDHWRAFYEEPRVCLADLVREGRMDAIEEYYSTSSLKKMCMTVCVLKTGVSCPVRENVYIWRLIVVRYLMMTGI